MDEHEILDRVLEFKNIADSGNGDLKERMATNFKNVHGDPWDPQERAWNEARGKACVHIPLIRPQTSFLTGQVVQNPKDITMVNHHGGMKLLADLQTALIKHAMSDESAKFEIAHWFQSGIETCSGYIGAFVSKDRDPLNGDIELRKLDPFDVTPDPTCKVYDWNSVRDGAKFVFWEPWVDKDYIKEMWPDKWREVVPDGPGGQTFASRALRFVFGVRKRSVATASGELLTEDYSELKVKLSHCWWKQYKEVHYLYDLRNEEGEPQVITDKKELAKAREAVKTYGDTFVLKKAVVPCMNHTIYANDVLLEHTEDELGMLKTGMTLFPIIPFYPFFSSGYKSTVVDDLIGVQKFVNYTRSATFNLLKGQANRGWTIKRDTGGFADWLQKHGSEDGVVIDESRGGGSVKKIDAAQLSTAHENLTQIGKGEFREITNLRTDAPERDQEDLSGRAIALKKESSETGISPILLNFDYSLNILGNYLSTLIRVTEVYSLREIKMVVEEKRLIDPKLLEEARMMVAMQLGIEIPQPAPFSKDAIMNMPVEQAEAATQQLEQLEAARQQVLASIDEIAKPIVIAGMVDAMRSPTNGRYFASVSTSASAPSARYRQFAETVELNDIMIKSGMPPLPPKQIIEASDVPNKEQILEEMGV